MLFVLFATGSIFNAAMLWKAFVRGHKHSTLVPLFPGIAGVVSFCLSPYPVLWRHFWLPLVIDPGCALTMVIAVLVSWPDIYATNPFFRIARLRSYDCVDVRVLVTLYSSGIYTLKKDNYHPRVSLSYADKWSLDDDVLTLTLGGETIKYSITLESCNCNQGIAKLNWVSSSVPSILDEIKLEQVNGIKLIN